LRGGKVSGAGVEETLGWGRKLGVFDGGAVAAHIDGVHDRQRATHAEGEAKKKSEDRRPEVHDR